MPSSKSPIVVVFVTRPSHLQYQRRPRTVLPTPVRKDWREIYAQKRAKCSNARCLQTGRTHEDLNEAKHIWRVKAQTEGDTKKDVSPMHPTTSEPLHSPFM